VNANEAIRVSLVQPSSTKPQAVCEFHPEFTYPIVGEAEQIFGYKELDIDLRFTAHDLRPNLRSSFLRKFPSVGGTSALDINRTLRDYLSPAAFDKPEEFDQTIQNDTTAKDWKPPGELVASYTRHGESYEIWAGSLIDYRIRSLLDNIQIFILFFIEGGQFINTDDVDWTLDRWRVYYVYRKSSSPSTPYASPYSFVGYATTYRFYRFLAPNQPITDSFEKLPPTETIKPKSLSSRIRISQFLILPNYQRGGHGSELYQAIYSEVMNDPTVLELTVEDPSEEFDKLRDINDFKILRPDFEKAGIKINTESLMRAERGRIKRVPTSILLPTTTLKEIRKNRKIAARQFARQVEMFLLANVAQTRRASGGQSLTTLKVQGARAADEELRKYYWWRILLKQRILKKNKDLLVQLDMEERLSRIEDSARGQEDEYEGMLLLYAMNLMKEEERNGDGSVNGGESSGMPSRKRKVIDEDDDDDDEMRVDSKRAKASTDKH
jgi:histone acetyltransferase 1